MKLITFKERSLADLQRAHNSQAAHMMLGPKYGRVAKRDVLIRNTMTLMKSADPLSIEEFLKQVAEPSWNSFFDIIDQGNIKIYVFLYQYCSNSTELYKCQIGIENAQIDKGIAIS